MPGTVTHLIQLTLKDFTLVNVAKRIKPLLLNLLESGSLDPIAHT